MTHNNSVDESRTLSTPEELADKASDSCRKESENRYSLAKVILIRYMILIIFSFSLPLITYKTIWLGDDKEPASKIVQILNAYMGTLTGLVGFVVGYYYKVKKW